MSENLAARVRRIVAANLNGLVDAMERQNADGVMREAVREVERALEEVRSEKGKALAGKVQAGKAIERIREKMAEMESKAAFAVEQGRDDLAEAALARQVDLERQIPVIEATASELSAREAELDGYAAALSARIREMEADLAAFAEARRLAGAMAPAGSPESKVQSAEKRAEQAGKAFERAMGAAGGVSPAEVKSTVETAARIDEIDAMQRANDIGERLAALKARRAG